MLACRSLHRSIFVINPLNTLRRSTPVIRVLLWFLLLVQATLSQATDSTVELVQFNRDIRPILSENCYQCHGPEEGARESSLRLDNKAGLFQLADGVSATVVPGNLAASHLYQRITSDDLDQRMPPVDSRWSLTNQQIDILGRWIEQGAIWEDHWSYIPPRRPAVPGVRDVAWPQGPIDRFVLQEMESYSMSPSPPASTVTLLRRLRFDLTGLPPRPELLDTYLGDDHPATYDRLVDRLLASPNLGERLAMYWLDLVRYADSVGYHGDQEHHITPYRGYVIKAFNENLPFDQFTIEQLAGDLLPDATTTQKIATGYNRLLQTSHEGGVQPKEYLAKYASDRIRNFSVVWMGATMGCAECHDHKYDPYTQRDFYSLVAFFADIDEAQHLKRANNNSPTIRLPEIEVVSPLEQPLLAHLQRQRDELNDLLPDATSSASVNSRDGQLSKNDSQQVALVMRQAQQLDAQIKWLNGRKRRTMITVSIPPRPIRVLPRGDWMDESGEVVQPAVPHFLPPIDVEGRRATRLDLAHWITRKHHPQTARVMVNRMWYLFFGSGLYQSLEDNGAQGEWPRHPELLDWLAVEFAENGWNVKSLLRTLVTSRSYRQSSFETSQLRQRDPENRLFARQSRFRLPAEMIRDNALAASGLLVNQIGGASARPYQPAGYYAHLNFPTRKYQHDTGANQYRRGVYTHWQRQFLHPMLKSFDAPSREECTSRRASSNTPSAALSLLNDPSMVEAARVLAERTMRQGGDTPKSLARWAWRRTLTRQPESREVKLLVDLYQHHIVQYEADREAATALLRTGQATVPGDLDVAQLAAWTSVTRLILNLNETITRN